MDKSLIKVFDEKIRTPGSSESFSLMMYEVPDPIQSELLRSVMANTTSCKHWYDYIVLVLEKGPTRRYMLTRLVRKALELLPEGENKDNKWFIALHLLLAQWCITPIDSTKYFQNICKRGVGKRSADMYLRWVDASVAALQSREDTIAILNQAIESNAEPRHEILSRLSQLSTTTTTADDDHEAPLPKQATTNPAIETATALPMPSASTKRPRNVVGGNAGGIGKCQRLKPTIELPTSDPSDNSRVTCYSPEETVSFSLDDLLSSARERTTGTAVAHHFHELSVLVEEGGESTKSFSTISRKSSYSGSRASSSSQQPTGGSRESLGRKIKAKVQSPGEVTQDNSVDLSVCDTMKLPLEVLELHKQASSQVAQKLISAVADEVVIQPNAAAGSKRVAFAPPADTLPGKVATRQSKAKANSWVDSTVSDLKSYFGSFLNDKERVVDVNGRKYLRLNILGKGGSTSVYRVMSKENELYAFKKIEIKGADEECEALCASYSNEIALLNQLKGSPYIIDLIDSEVDPENYTIAMILEAGEVDLAKVLTNRKTEMSDSQQTGGPFFTRTVWHDMLCAVDCIHQHRIVHSDLKPANFVFVRGQLKLIDFGIAKAMSNDTTSIYRDNQVGTINYMSPEAIEPYAFGEDESKATKMKLGKPSDVWSLGIILYQLVYGSPPFAKLSTIQKLAAIPNHKYPIEYPDHPDQEAVATIRQCLVREIPNRATISGPNGLLSMPFLTVGRRRAPLLDHLDKENITLSQDKAADRKESRSKRVATQDISTAAINSSSIVVRAGAAGKGEPPSATPDASSIYSAASMRAVISNRRKFVAANE